MKNDGVLVLEWLDYYSGGMMKLTLLWLNFCEVNLASFSCWFWSDAAVHFDENWDVLTPSFFSTDWTEICWILIKHFFFSLSWNCAVVVNILNWPPIPCGCFRLFRLILSVYKIIILMLSLLIWIFLFALYGVLSIKYLLSFWLMFRSQLIRLSSKVIVGSLPLPRVLTSANANLLLLYHA